MKKRPVLILVGLATLGFLALLLAAQQSSPEHTDESLEVTVRFETAAGAPLRGAVVATVRQRRMISKDSFRTELAAALSLSEGRERDPLRLGPIGAVRTTLEPLTIIRTTAWVTRRWFGPVLTGRSILRPQVLLVEHSDYGTTVIRIDPATPVDEGDQPNTWRMDLGKIRIPAR